MQQLCMIFCNVGTRVMQPKVKGKFPNMTRCHTSGLCYYSHVRVNGVIEGWDVRRVSHEMDGVM